MNSLKHSPERAAAGPPKSTNEADRLATKDFCDTKSSAAEAEGVPPVYKVLIVEDNGVDEFLIREAISTANLRVEPRTLLDGDQAIRFFEEADRNKEIPCPDLVLLDLSLPKRTGSEVLQRIRRSDRNAQTPVLIVTSSGSESDRVDAAKFGATAYFIKPFSYADFLQLGSLVKDLLNGHRPGITRV